MATRKDGSVQNSMEDRNTDISRSGDLSSDRNRLSEEDQDTETVSSDVEEGDEDYDDEELNEDDFDVDEEDADDEEEGEDEER